MNHKVVLRPGGRSARIQDAVHQAVKALQEKPGQAELTVPAIAAYAGVTPSTIYRRWGDLSQLLSDVAVAQLRPDSEPKDAGSFKQDIYIWVEQYLEEMSSQVGRAMLRDVLGTADSPNAGKCAGFTCQQIELIRNRAETRGERTLASTVIIDKVVAPLIYHILFSEQTPSLEYANQLLDQVFNSHDVR